MTESKTVPRWHDRLKGIPSVVEQIVLPSDTVDVAQDEEWCDVVVAGEKRRIRFHDYHEIYAIPGLYEELFYQRLKCCSPSRTVALLLGVLADNDQRTDDLRVLDLGAGNGSPWMGDKCEQVLSQEDTMSTGIHEVNRRAIFSEIVRMQDRGVTVSGARTSIAQEFGLSTETVLEIETEGIAKQWPPLNESLADRNFGEEI